MQYVVVIQAGNYSRSTALLEADDSSPEKSVSVFFSYHDVNFAQVRLNLLPGLKVNELSARRKEIKAIELERCLMSSECIGWLRHVYVPKVGRNHRTAIKSFTISQKIQWLQTTCI